MNEFVLRKNLYASWAEQAEKIANIPREEMMGMFYEWNRIFGENRE